MYCSAFVTYAYVQLGLLPKDTDWADWAPADLAHPGLQFLGEVTRVR